MLAIMVGLGVVILPILRIEGLCPMAHFINITTSIFLGPWYSFLAASLIGLIRMISIGIPPLALTGAIFGAFLSGPFYRLSRGSILLTAIGTGFIGSIVSYPAMTYIWGRNNLAWPFIFCLLYWPVLWS